jgi:uncharacterized membrane protein
MIFLIIGLILFLGIHSTRLAGESFRQARLASLGENAWKGMYSLVSLVGLVLIIWGYGVARQSPVVLYSPPIWTKHIAALLMLVSLVLMAAVYVPRNAIKAKLKHPMILGTKVWALAHLLANGTLADVLLFGGFLVWAVFGFRSMRQRDRAAGLSMPRSTSAAATIITVAIGLVLWAAFAFYLHGLLFGVRPLGR